MQVIGYWLLVCQTNTCIASAQGGKADLLLIEPNTAYDLRKSKYVNLNVTQLSLTV